ncbi:MAG: NAD+ synthase [Pseudanabaenaceae cyanobacterium bins.68]|nr:NAD+ synthase [Pseudanabaenaceae cyanobacterium bins.68]
MKIAIAQLNPTVGDLKRNHDQILAWCEQLEAVDLVITPELYLCGYPPRDLLLNPAFVQEMEHCLQSLAANLPQHLHLLVGMAELNPQAVIAGEKPLFNSAVLLQQGQIIQRFHKRLLPTYDVFDEARYFQPGIVKNWTEIRDRTHRTWRLGVTICEDIWNQAEFWQKKQYSQDPLADLAAQNLDLVVNLSASPYAMDKPQLRRPMLSHCATSLNLPLVYANQVGANDDLIFDGNSCVINRDGAIALQLAAWQPDRAVYDLDAQPLPAIDPVNNRLSDLLAALMLGVQDYCAKCGFKKVLLGLSGGIDSAVVAAIASFALGSENVLALLLPSPYSSEHSITDGISLANNLGITTRKIPIAPIMTAFELSLAEMFDHLPPDLTEENIQSRIRGSLLMAVSNKFGHLLLSTGNKSELAVGYCTLYGDMNGGLAVIADLPKTLVYELAVHINSHFNHPIPAQIITKPPSAELRPGQLDQDTLPDYEVLDQILEMLIQQQASFSQIVEAGFKPEVVQQVINLIARAEFKRKQAPLGLRVSDRAFGSGWRMPIASQLTLLQK